MNGIRLFFKNGYEEVRTVCFKTVARSRIPAAESGRETTTTFRLPEESVLCSSPRQDPGPGLERVRRVANSEARAQRAGASLHLGPGDPPWWVVSQGRGSGHRQAAFLRGTKVELTPSTAGRAPAAWSSPRSSPGSRPGQRMGEGVRAAAPPPAARGDLLIKTATPSRRRSASYLRATAAAAPPAPASSKHCRNDSFPAALKIPDKESRNSRFPTSQS